jgi:DNA-binding TFAR19-related protein (PDSD5 family)
MSDPELERLRKRRLLQMQSRLQAEKAEAKATGKEDPLALLNRVFVDRAQEVFEVAKQQYPKEMKRLEESLVQLVSEGKITEKISGADLLGFLRQLGLRVHLETRIRFAEHGKLESLEEKMKETE